MALVCLLRCYDRIVTTYDWVGKRIVRSIRDAVGPEPDQVLLLATGDVVGSGLQGLDCSGAFVYNPEANTLLPIAGETVGRRRPLPIIALRVGDRDLSDWVGEIRGVSLPSLSATQLVRLWSLSQRVYVRPGSPVYAMTNAGEESTTML